ncbi:chromosomal replication initiator protein DnaA [Dialister invisus DSM 15470]|jgi:chromosomal replication initiator protein|uniref:Chromosomal replication initiator protein DnaA n=1 Tax=Dialister invisus DSM 15470 TaxID=592028 RepID=C9LP67_9FIRM|nr:chromosomal replication initiator protein DnaA [Dialister invisus]EEW97353.1 chromosomal replication initiator protein DnaA [Dialister invisus DSM 15470]
MEIFELWTHVLEEIKIKNPEYYNNFYSFIFPISFSDGIFTAISTVPYMIPWINAVYKKKIEKILSEKSGVSVKLVLKTQESSDVPTAEPTPEIPVVTEVSENFGIPSPSSMSDTEKKENSHASVDSHKTEENMEIYDKPAVPDFMNIKPQNPEEVKLPSILDNPSSIRHSAVPLPVKSPEKKFSYKFDDYTFDNFVHGNCNEIAFQSAHAIALSCEEYTDSPDTNYSKKKPEASNYNPLFIYGPSGLGKTHLLLAISNYVKTHRPDLSVLFVTSENFTNELIESIRSGKMQEFREKYRTVDYLLIDDIQFFNGTKESSRMEIFNTFNAIADNDNYIITTSDRTPSDLKDFHERLITRFSSGMIAHISPPDFEICSIILQKKAERSHIDMSEEVISFIAGNVNSSVRELEGAFKQVVGYCQIKNVPLTLENARDALADIIKVDLYSHLSAETIIDTVCKYYNVKKEQVLGKSRPKNVVIPRQMAMYIAREELNDSFPSLEKYFNKDHSTIVHAYERVQKELKNNDRTRKELKDILTLLKRKR